MLSRDGKEMSKDTKYKILFIALMFIWAAFYLYSKMDIYGAISPGFLYMAFLVAFYRKKMFNNKEKQRKEKCKHSWELADKWQDGKKTYWEFYCHNCMAIEVVKQ